MNELEFGEQRAEIRELSRRVGILEEKSDMIIKILNEQRGGWKIFGVLTATTGFIAWLITWLRDVFSH